MAYSKDEEFQLIEDILNGDRNQYKVLVDRYSSLVFSVVRRFADRENTIEELAQQIFVKAYEKLDTFNRNSRFSSWLYSLARFHCLDYAKNVRRSNTRFSEMEQQELEAEMIYDQTADLKVEKKEWKALLNEALSQITPMYAEAFLLKYRDDMTYRAMAKRLDASENALKVRVHRAREELKEYFENNT